jgi:hypothetical protein
MAGDLMAAASTAGASMAEASRTAGTSERKAVEGLAAAVEAETSNHAGVAASTAAVAAASTAAVAAASTAVAVADSMAAVVADSTVVADMVVEAIAKS